MLPPLELHNYWIEELVVQANPKYQKEIDTPTRLPEIDFDIVQAPRTLKFMVCMKISLNLDDEAFATSPYRIVVTITGHYSFQKHTKKQTVQKMIAPNGLAILFGIARATIAQATACGRHGKYILPTIDLISVIRSKMEKNEIVNT